MSTGWLWQAATWKTAVKTVCILFGDWMPFMSLINSCIRAQKDNCNGCADCLVVHKYVKQSIRIKLLAVSSRNSTNPGNLQAPVEKHSRTDVCTFLADVLSEAAELHQLGDDHHTFRHADSQDTYAVIVVDGSHHPRLLQ